MNIDQTSLIRTIPWSQDRLAAWETNADHAFDPFLSYTDRATYLAWVTAWKQDYADLTAEIRAMKQQRPELQRAGAYDKAAVAPYLRAKRFAFALLALRRVAKRDSWEKRRAANVA